MKLIYTLSALLTFCCGHSFAAERRPIKVFILAGQSNMQGHATIETFDYIGDEAATAPLLQKMRGPDGKPRVVDNVWISSVGCAGDGYSEVIEQKGKLTAGFGASPEKIGPEFTFGITVQEALGGPVLIIKTAWGGRSLITDFRPPSAGKRTFNDYTLKKWKERGLDLEEEAAKNNEKCGVFYGHMMAHVKKVLGDIKSVVPDYDPAQGYELAGFVWFQGFNDYVDDWSYPNQRKPGGYDEYGQLLTQFIRDVRKDLNAPKLPFVIGVMGIDGKEGDVKAPMMNFRQAQLAPILLPEFKDNVIAVQTAPFWSDELAAIEKKRERVEQEAHLLRSKGKNRPNKDGTMTKEQQRDYMMDFEAKLISPAETALWKRGGSNGGYHYLGCAKTFALVGKAFAEATLQMIPPQSK
jgi:alpha-galactosidase